MKGGKTGRPLFVPAPTFDEAMKALKPEEAQMVRHVLAGDSYTAAARKAYPASPRPVRQGTRVVARKPVAHALALGKAAGALTAIAGIKYDLTAAHDEINGHIQEAVKQENMNAVASLMREKLKLHKLTDTTPAAMAGAQFTLVIRGADGYEKVIQPHVIDIQPKDAQ